MICHYISEGAYQESQVVTMSGVGKGDGIMQAERNWAWALV